jgi:hypothetical protein
VLGGVLLARRCLACVTWLKGDAENVHVGSLGAVA